MLSAAMFIVLFGVAVNGATTQLPQLGGKIVGGQDTTISKYPWQVSLQMRNRHFCGGSLISNRTVLTAAHCVDLIYQTNQLTIRIGSTNSNRGGQKIGATQLIVHPKWSRRTLNNDVALIHLKSAPTIRYASAVPLPAANISIPNKAEIIATGWGNTREGGRVAETLQEITVPYVPHIRCKETYKAVRGAPPVTDQMLCAGGDSGEGVCNGDSGGPAFWDNQIVGVVSWSLGCARPRFPGVYARVTEYLDWIAENTLE